jgi:tRNA pseudouridine55 synthase
MYNNFSGYLLVNKPSGLTSHDVIDFLRKITQIKKIGHAGTLDPLAEGLLFVAIGRQATKNINNFVLLDKEYEACLMLGQETDTYDAEGVVVKKYQGEVIMKKKIKMALNKFIGEQKQIPPMYSAKKIKGRKLYEIARENKVIDRESSLINIEKIKLKKYNWPNLYLKIKCSSGTYIRSLAYDIGLELACGAYLKALKRTRVGKFKLKNAYSLEEIKKDNWQKLCFKKIIN